MLRSREILRFLFSPHGRISRFDIWIKYFLPSFVIGVVANEIDTRSGLVFGDENEYGVLSTPVHSFYLWPHIAVSIKRFHDLGYSGWWVLYSLLFMLPGAACGVLGVMASEPIILIIGVVGAFIPCVVLFIFLYFSPGQKHSNRFGDSSLVQEEEESGAFGSIVGDDVAKH